MSFIHFIRKLNIYFGFSKCENCERKLGRYVTIIDGKRVCEICSKINQVDTMIKFIEMENDNRDGYILRNFNGGNEMIMAKQYAMARGSIKKLSKSYVKMGELGNVIIRVLPI